MIIDTYKTIKSPSSGIYKEKGSKFLSFAYPVYSEEEFKKIRKNIGKEFHDARHRCFAFRLGLDNYYRMNDDGEPSGTAGKPIYGQILSRDLTNVLIFVVRYFGGTLLGTSGLIRSYKESAAEALNHAEVVTKTIDEIYKISFNYGAMSNIMRILKEENLEQFDQYFTQDCELKFKVRKKNAVNVLGKINQLPGLKTEYLKTV